MPGDFKQEPMVAMFIFETVQLLEQLEQLLISSEKQGYFTEDAINEIFRIMHTMKGSSSMMGYNNISALTHSMEDFFYFLRETNPQDLDYTRVCDMVLEGIDFIKTQIERVESKESPDGNASPLIQNINAFLATLKGATGQINPQEGISTKTTKDVYNANLFQAAKSMAVNSFKAVVYFEEDCQMENIRAYSIIHKLMDICQEVSYFPEDIINNDKSAEVIAKDGFQIWFKTDRTLKEMQDFLSQTIFLKNLKLTELSGSQQTSGLSGIAEVVPDNLDHIRTSPSDKKIRREDTRRNSNGNLLHQGVISVGVAKLDRLMDLVGELVVSQDMVIQNSDLKDLELDNFQKAARQLQKITSELQDTVMSIRMVPVATTFLKMHRIIRDMCKKLGKEVELEIIGEDTEVDKNIIERISDPLMHLVRNAIDHGMESPEDRQSNGKAEIGTITLEAKNSGSDVLIIVKDDGRGLNKKKIIDRAKEMGLLNKAGVEMSDREIYNLILRPGFSTKGDVTEFSGRGVGMDVVAKNIEAVGGAVSIDSVANGGTVVTLKIPLTLAIIGGINIRVGGLHYTIPTISIKEFFSPREEDIITDVNGDEMVMVRNKCYPIFRLHQRFKIKDTTTKCSDGIFIMVEDNNKTFCIFADELIGEQQVVVKALPNYIRRIKRIKGLAGCTLLGDGGISLILDISELYN